MSSDSDGAPGPVTSAYQTSPVTSYDRYLAHIRELPWHVRMEIYSTQIPEWYVTPFCGASAGVASGIVTCPLDVIKTKLQAQGGFLRRRGPKADTTLLYRGMVGTGKMIWREEGLRGLYRGLGPMLLGYLPTWAVYLTVYDKSRDFFHQKTGESIVIHLPLGTNDC
jgi:solute carrier family 25 folate transporter 32